MTSPNAATQEGLRIGMELGNDSFKEVLAGLDSLDSELSEFLTEAMGRIFGRSQLSLADREVCIVAALAVQGHLPQMKWHLNAALNIGVPLDTLREVLIQTIPYAGWPVGLTSLGVLKEVALSRDLTLDSEPTPMDPETRYAEGVKNGKAIYPNFEAALQGLRSFDPALPDLIIESSFGSIYGRPNLDMRRREMIAVAMLAALQRLPQLQSHLIGAHCVGCTHEETKEILVTLIAYAGWPVALNALAIWKQVTTA